MERSDSERKEEKMEDLRRCPFCGGEAELWHNSNWDYVVRCRSCKARTRQHHENDIGAMMDWNRRTERGWYERNHEASCRACGYVMAEEDAAKLGACPRCGHVEE